MNGRIAILLAAAAAVSSAASVYTTPAAGTEIINDYGVVAFTTTVVGAADLSRVQCFAWYGYVPSGADGRALTSKWGTAISMAQTRVGSSNTFTADLSVINNHVLQATSYCVVDGQLLWAPSGNVAFHFSAGASTTPSGWSVTLYPEHSIPAPSSISLPASSPFALSIAEGTSGPSWALPYERCVARFGYPARFGGAWPTVNETQLSFDGYNNQNYNHWLATIPMPARGKLLEVTARCTFGGIESWLQGNYRITAN
eukprot:m51a1_g8348 hypothetical protein (256) ;mRNA; f:43970-44864